LELLIFIGIFIGVIFRTVEPFLRKLNEGKLPEPIRFEKRYIITAVATLAWAFELTLKLFKAYAPPPETGWYVFVASVLFGYGNNTLTNEVMKLILAIRRVRQVVEGRKMEVEEG